VSAVEWLFWCMAAGLLYIYVGYALTVYLLSKLRPNPILKRAFEPLVTIVIAAYNEAGHIGATIANKLSLDYPPDKLDIIVVSDGSTDGTDAIAQGFTDPRVRVYRQEPRNGKTSALNLAVQHAGGEILVFADANSLYDARALTYLTSNFADPSIGYVTGKLGYRNPDGTMTGDGCSAYMRYENFVRECESQVGSLVGVNGGIDAVRRTLYEPMHADDLPDLVLPLRVVKHGFRVVYEPLAQLSETANSNPEDEYRMRVRVSLRALWTLAEMPEIFNVRKLGFFAVQVFSHKVLRYLAFVFMVGLLMSAAALWPVGQIYRIALLLEIAFAAAAVAGFVAERLQKPSRLFAVPYYFMLVNTAALHACVKFLKGERHRVWRPRLG
jgi:cellulose synthase/poly-beta-1,6-N-acetylglucosamine synthase-like glycosyltransferase